MMQKRKNRKPLQRATFGDTEGRTHADPQRRQRNHARPLDPGKDAVSTETIRIGTKEIILVGTAHVSRDSVQEVRESIQATNPDVVAVELCKRRYDVLRNPKSWQDTDIVGIIREKKASFLFANLVLAAFQKRIGEKLGVRPGQEMHEAIVVAEAAGIPVALIDRPVQITLQRTWRMLSFKERFMLIASSITAIFETEDLDEDTIEKLKEKDVLTAAVDEIGKRAPTVKKVFLDERDAYMGKKISDLEGSRILAVVGAGHLQGLMEQLKDPIDDISPLEYVPEKKRALWKWLVPLVIFALVAGGFYFGGTDRGVEMVKWWFISNAVFAALGTALALGHPISVIVAACASPITSMNPTLAAGWFAGLSEAYLRRPKVADFERLQEDILSVRGFWRNSVTRILLVVVFANLGSSVGAYLAMPILTKIIFDS
jgi:pheromone shutdown-related protein TraB